MSEYLNKEGLNALAIEIDNNFVRKKDLSTTLDNFADKYEGLVTGDGLYDKSNDITFSLPESPAEGWADYCLATTNMIPSSLSELNNDTNSPSVITVELPINFESSVVAGTSLENVITADQIIAIGAAHSKDIIRLIDNTGAYFDTTFIYYSSATDWNIGGRYRSTDVIIDSLGNILFMNDYVVCNTSGDTEVKTITKPGFSLVTGVKIVVKFTYAHTASSMTLNVNNTGAVSCLYRNAALVNDLIVANGIYEFIYDGTYWQLLGGVVPTSVATLTTTRYINGMGFNGSANRTNYVACYTSAATAAKTASVTGYSLLTGSQVRVKFTYANTASAPTLNITSTGAKSMRYKGVVITGSNFTFDTTKIYTFTYTGTYYDLEGDWDIPENPEYSALPVTNKTATIPISVQINNITTTSPTPTYYTNTGESFIGGFAGLYYLCYDNQPVSQPFGWFGLTDTMKRYPIKVHPIVLNTSASTNSTDPWIEVYLEFINTNNYEPYIRRILNTEGNSYDDTNLSNCEIRGIRLGTFG